MSSLQQVQPTVPDERADDVAEASVEIFIEGHLLAALGELRAAAKVAALYYDHDQNNPIAKAVVELTTQYDRFLTAVSTRRINRQIQHQTKDR